MNRFLISSIATIIIVRLVNQKLIFHFERAIITVALVREFDDIIAESLMSKGSRKCV
jgi:hypothetical protein